MRPRTIARMGWVRDIPDNRDLIFQAPRHLLPPPASIDLRPKLPPPYDQLQLGSCTANGIAGALEFDQRAQGLPEATPSRLFIYYGERVIERTVSYDSGAQIRDGIKVVAQLGACPETLWPYDESKFTLKPSEAAYEVALLHPAVLYQRVNQDEASLKSALASGFPVIFGFSVYESFESLEVAQTGVANLPHRHESLLGGHCALLVGYDDATGHWLIRNSWGTDWGDKGYFTLPYAYLTNRRLSSDFWTITATK